MYEVVFANSARDVYADAPSTFARKLERCFAQLEKDPLRHPNIKRLTGSFSGMSRFRVGDYRVIFRVDREARVVFIIDIAHRRDVYE